MKGENPAKRSQRYARELKNGKKVSGEKLTPSQAGFRIGVLNERKWCSSIYNYKSSNFH